MTMEEICALPVGEWAADNCALFLWGTFPRLFDLKTVLEAWGFGYSGLAWVWRKYNAETGKYAFGPGYGTRKNLELCVLARKGHPTRWDKSVRDWMDLPEPDFLDAKRREHSRKPDEQYELIERLFDGDYLEMFSRGPKRKGWTQWGNEVGKFDEK
jgi:N6-adenosine-specific RNA methylase IME4